MTTEYSALAVRAREIYGRIRATVETPDKIGQIIVIDTETGDYEIDPVGVESAHRLQARHPGAALFGLRIGYNAMDAIGGTLERLPQ